MMNQCLKKFLTTTSCMMIAATSFALRSLPQETTLIYAETANEKKHFWDVPRRGTNFMNSTSIPENYKIAKEKNIEYVRLAPDKWAKHKDFLCEGKPDQSNKDFLIGNVNNYTKLVVEDVAMLKKDLDAAHSHNMKVVVTVLSLPGNRWRQFNGNKNDDRLWEQSKYIHSAKKFWRDLAEQLKDHPAIVGYNVINEPHPETSKENRFRDFWTEDYAAWYAKVKGTSADLNIFYKELVHSIREVDKHTPIILDAGNYATPWAFKYLEPIPNDDRVLYSFHMYEPYNFTSQKENQPNKLVYPGTIKVGDNELPMMWNKKTLKTFLKPVQEWTRRHHIPSHRVIAAEFGCNRTTPGATQYFQDLIAIFNEFGWHKAFYAFREDTWSGMDYEFGTNKTKWNEQPMRIDNSLWNVIKSDYASHKE